MQHLDEGTIHAWLDGALSADEAARVELHVAVCETCSDAVAEARGLIAASSRIVTALDDVPRVPRARAGRGDRGAPRPFLVRWRIAAVVALVVGGGALALAVRRDSISPVAREATADSGSEIALVAIDSPALETQVVANAEPSPRVRDGAAARRGVVGAATGNTPARPILRDRDLMSVAPAESASPTVAQLDVSAAAAPPSAPPARTDDTAGVPSAVADAARLTPDPAQVEAQSPVAEKVASALGARRSVPEAAHYGARAAQPAINVVGKPNAPPALTEEQMVEDGRVVVRRVYRVEETLVTLDERAPREEVEQQERRERLQVLEERLRRVERAPEQAARLDSAPTAITTIRWVDSRGAEFTLSGAVSREQLERFRRLLGH